MKFDLLWPSSRLDKPDCSPGNTTCHKKKDGPGNTESCSMQPEPSPRIILVCLLCSSLVLNDCSQTEIGIGR